ncbi:hypothetical protein GCM10010452_21640 [Crossiella cryophila]
MPGADPLTAVPPSTTGGTVPAAWALAATGAVATVVSAGAAGAGSGVLTATPVAAWLSVDMVGSRSLC